MESPVHAMDRRKKMGQDKQQDVTGKGILNTMLQGQERGILDRTGEGQDKEAVGMAGTRMIRDISNRNILKDPLLCVQFLRDFVDRDFFGSLQPEDIEDESEKYQAYLGVSFETDTVKRIHMHMKEGKTSFYLISLVEHKSIVDYNVSMQILRYMVCIWNEYGKEMVSLKKGDIRNKGFRYPPILPIVYYEGKGEWTAGLHLKDRIMLNEIFENYIPDFTYRLIRLHDYSNEELLGNEDEMSLLMMLGKAQTPEDMHRLLDAEKEKVEEIIKRAPEHILELIASMVWNLCMKMNVPQGEAEQYTRKVRERQMGYWLENMEEMDIQAERRNTAQAREEARKAQEEAIKASEKMREAYAELAETAENSIRSIINVCRKMNVPAEQIVEELMESCQMDRRLATEKVNKYL